MFNEVIYIIYTFKLDLYCEKMSQVKISFKSRNVIILDNVLKLTQVDELNIYR